MAGFESSWRRQARIREERQEKIREQLETGSLVIRQATAEERERYGIRSTDEDERGAEQ